MKRLLLATTLALASTQAQAFTYINVPDWVLPTLEAAPPRSLESVVLSLWILGWPCPELDNQFAPQEPPPIPPVAYISPPIIEPPGLIPNPPWNPPPGGPTSSVPEPSTWAMLILGFAMLLWTGKRKAIS